MSRLARWLGAVAVALMPLGAVAQQNVVMVELYTSQGCHSCPPADAFLGELSKRDNVLALAFHVDYWDYLGWKDGFGKATHTKRQRVYAATGKRRSIFTPELIVGGTTSIVGHAKRKINAEVKAHLNTPAAVALEVAQSGDQVMVKVAQTGPVKPAGVFLVTYQPKAQVAIKQGENRGKTLTYHNPVLDMVRLGNWSGEGEASYEGTVPAGDVRHAVFVQAAPQGPILAAAKLK